eukprot:TRINITY_DN3646_c0_g1_i1.p1 TRINITY_DN3646_c0_g1~~TRINITY_DN3646_c0_g1_i1.p1  ORF type:complete len:900 (-),score=235.64 TRINITY_DN3646_c0_g1_i1:92-2791(-)
MMILGRQLHNSQKTADSPKNTKMAQNDIFRNLRGQVSSDKREWFLDLNLSPSDMEGRFAACSPNWIIALWGHPDVSDLDTIALLSYDDFGKHYSIAPVFDGHGVPITDMMFNPFDHDSFASADGEGFIHIWKINGVHNGSRTDPDMTLKNDGPVLSIDFHPIASNILACGSGNELRIWNLRTQEIISSWTVSSDVQSVSWSEDGELLAAGHGLEISVFQARSRANSPTCNFKAHQSGYVKVKFCKNVVISTGKNRYMDREVTVWDPKNGKSLKNNSINRANSSLSLEYDVDTGILYLFGKGDQNVRRFQVVESSPYIRSLTASSLSGASRYNTILPRQKLDFYGSEVICLLSFFTSSVKPVHFLHKQGKNKFCEEYYPPVKSEEAALNDTDWLGGASAEPNRLTLRPDGEPLPEVETNPYDNEVKEEWYVPEEMNIVRSTHYRHIFGEPFNASERFTNLRIENSAASNSMIKGNSTYFAIPWKGVGGKLAVFNLDSPGRTTSEAIPTIETGSVIHDYDFNPFNKNVIATGQGNGEIKLWTVPQGGLMAHGENIYDCDIKLVGHRNKITTLGFHPSAENVLVSSSGDLTVKLWNAETGQAERTVSGFGGLVGNVSWNYTGSLLSTSSKDGVIRVVDPRAESIVHEGPDCGGSKGSRVAWLGRTDKLFTVGFARNNDRIFNISDIRMLDQNLQTQRVDSGTSILEPVFDEDTGVMMLWSRGDSSIKFFEITDEEPYSYYLTDYSTLQMQVALCFLHKSASDIQDVEIARCLKLHQTYVEPIRIRVPRTRMEYFQDDIFSPTRALEPTYSTDEYFSNTAEREPILQDLNPGLDLLSSAPKILRKMKKYVRGEEEIDQADMGEQTIDTLYDRMMDQKDSEDEVLPWELNEGAGSDEWDDSSSY